MALTKVAPAGIGSTPGDGYRIGSSFLHSTGVEITNINATGILTAASLDISGSIDFDGHTELDNVNIAGVVTATTFKGDGSQLTGLTAGQIPDLSGAKITSGTVAAARIDNLAASKITSGTLGDARIPNLNASKITAGTMATARLGSGTANNTTYLRGDQTWAAAGPGTGQQYVNLESLGSASNTGNNTFAGYLSGNALNNADHSTFFGYQAGKAALNAGNNCFFGSNSGLIATGGDNSGFGQGTLETITSATSNVAVGRRALNTTTSSENVAVGAQALRYQSTGQKNTAVGYQAGLKITTANYNTAFGYKTLTGDGESHNVTGHSNVVMGYMSGYGISSGERNVLIGYEAGYDMTTGNWNSGLGHQVLENVGVGTCNTAIGYRAGYTINNGNNNICIGNQVTATASDTSNEVTIGNSAVTKFRIPGINFVLKDNGGTPSSGQVLTADGSGEGYWAAASGTTINNNADNRIITGSGTANTLEGESTLTYDGSSLMCTGGTIVAEKAAIPTIESKNSQAASYARIYLSQTSGSGGYFAINKIGTGGSGYAGGANATQLWASGDAPMLFATNNTERLRIDSNGHVLLGTTTGGLTDYGDSLTIADANAGMTLRVASTTQSSHIYFADGTSGDTQYRGYVQYNHSSDLMKFGTAAAERLRIKSDGKVIVTGDGQTNSDYGIFQVNQAADNDEGGIAILNDANSRSMRLYCDGSANSVINSGDGGAAPLVLNEGSGKVLIGSKSTGNEVGKLDIYHTSDNGINNPHIRLHGPANNDARIEFGTQSNAGEGAYIMYNDSDEAMYIGSRMATYSEVNICTGMNDGSPTSNVRWSVDAAGRVQKHVQPGFGASQMNGWTNITGSTYAVTSYGRVHHNYGSHFNSSNGRFTAPVNGRYLFTAIGMGVQNTAPHIAFGINNSSNGGGPSRGGTNYGNNDMWSHPSSSYYWVCLTHILDLSANDYVRVYTYDWATSADAVRCYFYGYLLG